MNLGLTGGIATGKSTVSAMLAKQGAKLVDADRIAREVVQPGSPVLSRVVQRFSPDILAEDGTLNRKKLGAIVFNDAVARQDLEAILHPPIRGIIKQRLAAFEHEFPDGLVVADVPLLFESKLQKMFQEVMLVYVPREIQIERLMKRDRLPMDEAERRLDAQMPIENKKALADIVIDNSGTLKETEQQVEAYWRNKGLG